MADLAENYGVEKFQWLTNYKHLISIDVDDLISWLVVDENQSTANEKLKHFCDGKLSEKMLQTNQKLDGLGLSDFQANILTKKANVFEDVGKSIFIDRSAVKLANMDSLLDGMFSKKIVPPAQAISLSTFKSVCFGGHFRGVRNYTNSAKATQTIAFIGGEPGGFVDYILWRKGWRARCFGFAPKASYRTSSFVSDPLSFQVYDGPGKDGDITNPKNLSFFIDLIKQKNRDGILQVFADVVLPVYRSRDSKEIVSKRLHLSCCAYALAVLTHGGDFIMKIFDVLTPFTVGLIYIMYKCFRKICIIKPHSSRPANGERYLICSEKLPESRTKAIFNHLLEINETMSTDEAEISELVALDILKEDSNFYSYVLDSNNAIMSKQIEATEKKLRFAEDPSLHENELKEAIKKKFLKLWNLPTSITTAEQKQLLPDDYAKDLYPNLSSLLDWIREPKEESLLSVIAAEISTRNYYFLPIENVNDNDRTYFLSKGQEYVYKFDKTKRIWTQITDITVKLPEKTLIYGEMITVYDAKNSQGTPYLHVIDGYVLGGLEIHSLEYIRRSSICHDFVLSVGSQRKYENNKKVASLESQMKIKSKDVGSFLQKLRAEKIGETNQLVANVGRTRYFVPKGMLAFHMDLPIKIWKWSHSFISETLADKTLHF